MGHVSLSPGAEVLQAAPPQAGGRAELAHEPEERVSSAQRGVPGASVFLGVETGLYRKGRAGEVTTGAMLTET